MTQDQKPATPPVQNADKGNEIDPREKEPIGPGGDRGGIDTPGTPASRNPGHTNPSHNTPGHTRHDQAGQQDKGSPGQGQTQSYPGVKGQQAHDLEQDNDIDRKEAERTNENAVRQEAAGQKATQFDGNPNPQGAPSTPLGPKDDTPVALGKESRNDQ